MSFIVAIDGPAGTGKGTVTKLISKELGLVNIDTGAMYRCVALQALRQEITSIEEKERIIQIAKNIDIKMKNEGEEQQVYLNGENVSKEIRTKEVSAFVSPVSSIPEVREIMVELQRKMAQNADVIMEGRDITTVVFPNADVKIYLDASVEERAQRRYKENQEKGIDMTYEEVLEAIKTRDYNDMHKPVGALKIAEDAIVIDTTHLTIGQVKGKVKDIIFDKRIKPIGSELCRQIVKYDPKRLVILDIYENNLYDIEMELRAEYPKLNLEAIVASVRDKARLNNVFETYKPEIVFHAAAHKHVPLMEKSPLEAIHNNVFGTYNVVNCADEYGVEKFVLISTDKAVNPTNIMGASKRVCEMIVQAKNKVSKTEYVAVRFGNVLGSNGSVIPLFKKQIERGGPVTVTHKDITRFFMTIPEAVQLILQAVTYAKGGEIFVLDMGEPVKIYDLAVSLIKLLGYEPNVDIPIEITGLRPGEKLYEEILMSEEGLTSTKHDKIFISKPMHMEMTELEEKLNILKELEYNEKYSNENIKNVMKEVVPTYREPEEVNKEKK